MSSLLALAAACALGVSGCASFEEVSRPTLTVDDLELEFTITYEESSTSQHHLRLIDSKPPLRARNERFMDNLLLMKDVPSDTLYGVIVTKGLGRGHLTFFSCHDGVLVILDRDTLDEFDSFLYHVMEGATTGPEEDRPKARKVIDFFGRNVSQAGLPEIRVDHYFPDNPRWTWGGTDHLEGGLLLVSSGSFGVYLDGPVEDLFRADRSVLQQVVVPMFGMWGWEKKPPRRLGGPNG